MANYSSVELYLQPYVVRYLETMSRLKRHTFQGVNDLPDDAVFFQKKCFEGQLIHSQLISSFERLKPFGRRTEKLIVLITEKYKPECDNRYQFIGISNSGCDAINNLIKARIISKLYRFVMKQKLEGRKEADSIQAFMLFYDMGEEVLQFEAAKKWFYRTKMEYESEYSQMFEGF